MSAISCNICEEIDPNLNNVENAEFVGVSEATIRRHRTADHNKRGLDEAPEQEAVQGTIDVSPDGAQVNNVVVDSPLNDNWDTVFALFNLDANKFQVVDETVRMSTWQQSKRLENGSRDTIQLYSYSARFRRVNHTLVRPEVVESWRTALQQTPDRPLLSRGHVKEDGTYTVLVADPQLGKKGTQEAVDNWKQGVLGHIARIDALERSGSPVAAVHVGFMGDEHEGVQNNYKNQPHIVELNLTRQIELDYDMRVWTIKQFYDLGYPLSVSSVISNHGEWTRNDSKDPETTKGDNSSTFVSRLVKKLFDELEYEIGWHIAEEEPGLSIVLSGVETYFSHGYVEKGRGATTEARMKNAIERQILGRTEQLGSTQLWFMAHYHHYYTQEFEGRTLFGCPALEAERSSEYMLDQYGVWSKPGMLGLVVTDSDSRGWSHQSIQ